mgnify:CR=1 FL=1
MEEKTMIVTPYEELKELILLKGRVSAALAYLKNESGTMVDNDVMVALLEGKENEQPV